MGQLTIGRHIVGTGHRRLPDLLEWRQVQMVRAGPLPVALARRPYATLSRRCIRKVRGHRAAKGIVLGGDVDVFELEDVAVPPLVGDEHEGVEELDHVADGGVDEVCSTGGVVG